MTPFNAARVAPAPQTLDRAAIEARLVGRVAEGSRQHLAPDVRGRGVRQSQRTKDVKRNRQYAASNLCALIADALMDDRVPTSGICLLLDELKLEAMDVRGELTSLDFDEAMLLETSAQGVTDLLQLRASRTLTEGTLAALSGALLRQAHTTQIAAAVTRRKLRETTEHAVPMPRFQEARPTLGTRVR